jgi:hypothetical protein
MIELDTTQKDKQMILKDMIIDALVRLNNLILHASSDGVKTELFTDRLVNGSDILKWDISL